MKALLLALFLTATPGQLDQNGGHINPVTGEYHLHAGPSYQYRYVDATGRIWEGNGPRPEENLRRDYEDFLWNSPFVPFLIFIGVAGAIGFYYVDRWLKRRGHRRRHTRRHA